MKIIGINGSHKKDDNCAFLLDIVLSDLEKMGCETKIYNATEVISDCKVPFCLCCSSPCNKSCYGEKLKEVFEEFKSADAVVFASPVYFGSMSGQLKCLFDKTRDVRANNVLLGKVGMGITSGASKYGGQEKALDAIHNCMFVNGMTIVGSSSTDLAGHMGICAQAPAKDDDFVISRAHSGAKRIFEEISKR